MTSGKAPHGVCASNEGGGRWGKREMEEGMHTRMGAKVQGYTDTCRSL